MNASKWTQNISLGLLLGLAGASFLPHSAVAAEDPAQIARLAPVNINQASAESIAEALNGIGLSRARAIVEYRDQHGPFKSIDDLANVKGVGSRTLEKNRSLVVL